MATPRDSIPKTVILCPTPIEARMIAPLLRGSCTILQCGIGAASVQHWAQRAELPPNSTVILAGCAGALSRSLQAGEAHWIEEVVDGHGAMWRPTISGLDGWRVLDLGRFIQTTNEKGLLGSQFDAQIVDMESAAFAQIATGRKWRWGIVRGISDGIDHPCPAWMIDVFALGTPVEIAPMVRLAMGLVRHPSRLSAFNELHTHLKTSLTSVARLIAKRAADSALRTLIFGGTFDPPHLAHVECASRAADILGCSRILVIPAAESPHRRGEQHSSNALRLEMTRVAFAADPRAQVLDIELRRGGVSYTVDTLTQLQRALGLEHGRTHLLLGADQALAFSSWRSWESILRDLALPAIMPRAPHNGSQLKDALRLKYKGRMGEQFAQWVLDMPSIDLSSSMIRDRTKARASLEGLVTPAVLELWDKAQLAQNDG
ncbi:MAG: nicotinate (nicotinamide) nucleotide adenylyltransferase [Planctomycetota bacterium]|nr:nicotinate (nicotinamide) nucleotide adenylyltransferase [Planctomycetota bacterium]